MRTLCFSVESSALKAALQACQEFVSYDATRPEINQVFAELCGEQLHLTATDGASLVKVTLAVVPRSSDGERLSPAGYVDSNCRMNEASIEDLLLRIKGLGSKDAVFVIADRPHSDVQFPDAAKVVPPVRNGGCSDYRMNALLVARVAKVQLLLKARSVWVQGPETPTKAIRFDVFGKVGVAVVVIMPMGEVST